VYAKLNGFRIGCPAFGLGLGLVQDRESALLNDVRPVTPWRNVELGHRRRDRVRLAVQPEQLVA
jgi:hypothetical protein